MGYTIHKKVLIDTKATLLCGAKHRRKVWANDDWTIVTCKNCLKRCDPDTLKTVADTRAQRFRAFPIEETYVRT
jgi:hypothetical protein